MFNVNFTHYLLKLSGSALQVCRVENLLKKLVIEYLPRYSGPYIGLTTFFVI